MKINNNIENVLTSYRVIPIIVSKLYSYFQDLANLNTLSNLKALRAYRALLPVLFPRVESVRETSSELMTTIIKSKRLNLS